MESEKEPENNLKESYLVLKQLSNKIENNYNELIKEEFDSNKWLKEGKEIETNINKFKESLKIVIKNLEDAKTNKRVKGETISLVDECLIKIKEEVEPKVKEMLEKISQFSIRENKKEKKEDESVKKVQQIFWNFISIIVIIVAIILFYKVALNIYN